MLTIIAIVCAISSIVASALVLAASMLSSRISQEQNLVEVYEITDETPFITPATYSLESKPFS